MQRTPVDSTSVASIGYDAELRCLEIEYVGDKHPVYQYADVPREVWSEALAVMRAGASVGKWVAARIKKGGFSFRLIEPTDGQGIAPHDQSGPRAWTDDEVRELFLLEVHHHVLFWAGFPEGEMTTKARLEGLVAAILGILDGHSSISPGYVVAPIPASTDRQFKSQNGQNWFPENLETDVAANIAGKLWESYRELSRTAAMIRQATQS